MEILSSSKENITKKQIEIIKKFLSPVIEFSVGEVIDRKWAFSKKFPTGLNRHIDQIDISKEINDGKNVIKKIYEGLLLKDIKITEVEFNFYENNGDIADFPCILYSIEYVITEEFENIVNEFEIKEKQNKKLFWEMLKGKEEKK